ncbi:MAG: tRNA pseudouridine(38-40) synthase TruA [Dissulfurispiraceae bacterium]
MRNIRLLIQYDGTAYSGWQIQTASVTIQGLIEKLLGQITSAEPHVIAAGRTDAGVHAVGQVACFRTSSKLSTAILQNALNALLPYDIRILETEEVDESFHARFSAKRKSYFYLVSTDKIVSPFVNKYVWRLPYRLDLAAMRETLSYLVGTHDFSSFRGSGCGAKTTERTIFNASVLELNAAAFMTLHLSGKFIKLQFEGDAFLRHMVRNMVGTVMEVGKGKMRPEDITQIIASKDRRCAGPTAPAHALFLESISY